MSRSLDDPTSWWFYAAIHGEYVSPDNSPEPPGFPGWGFITPRPQVPATPLPAQAVQDSFWNQCQHGSWYFFPWHRGYLMALEAQLRQDIIDLGGPADWALPYWNYFGGEDASQYPMPPAFAETALPDGSDNPLFVAMRYGANNDRKIYIPTPAGSAAMGDPGFTVTEDALSNDLYSGTNPQTPAPGFGGPETGFEHRGGDHGNLEKDPHDLVHVAIGGGFSRTNFGLMSNPGTAALDPVFYLHHANIDRLWAVWNAGGNSNPTSADWLNGPVDRPFVMPDPAGQPWSYTPMQVQNLASLNYTYEELQASPLAGPAGPLLANRFSVLGAAAAAEKAGQDPEAFLARLFRQVPVLDTGARGSTTTFVQRNQGDVLLSWENEAHLARQEFPQAGLEIVYPPLSILAEPPVAVVDQNVDRRGTRALAEAYLRHLYTEAGQSIAARHFYRPRNAAILAAHARQFPALELVTVSDVFQGWADAQRIHFNDGGVFDRIYRPGR